LQRIDLTLHSLGLSIIGRRACRQERRTGERAEHQRRYVKSVSDGHRESPVVRPRAKQAQGNNA
jgi:hypothetical protein